MTSEDKEKLLHAVAIIEHVWVDALQGKQAQVEDSCKRAKALIEEVCGHHT